MGLSGSTVPSLSGTNHSWPIPMNNSRKLPPTARRQTEPPAVSGWPHSRVLFLDRLGTSCVPFYTTCLCVEREPRKLEIPKPMSNAWLSTSSTAGHAFRNASNTVNERRTGVGGRGKNLAPRLGKAERPQHLGGWRQEGHCTSDLCGETLSTLYWIHK